MKYLQKLGRSLMLPVACLPVAGLLMGVGYWIDPVGWGGGNAIAMFLLGAGGAIIDNMAILFAIGIAVGMADDHDGTAGLAGLVSWLMVQKMLAPATVAVFQGITVDAVNPAFGKVNNQFIGILCGLIGAICYNKFKNCKLPDFLAFFSGKRSVAIVTALVTLVVTLGLFFVWPIIYSGLVAFGTFISGLGAIGAGIYGFFNRLLIPVGLHHALNSVFWFDAVGIADLWKFWGLNGAVGVMGETGMYMTGFFPIMMFGLPGAALAMYTTAKDSKKKATGGILLAAALCSFFTGVTEPLEFLFMFLAPGLYLVHAVLTGISVGLLAALPIRAGFTFSAGFVDWFLSFKVPFAQQPLLLIPIGLVFFALYFIIFRVLIKKFNLKTPGREDDENEDETTVVLKNNDFTAVAKTILEGLGGPENVTSVDNCITRLRLEVKDYLKVDEKKIKSAGIAGVIRPSKTSVQVIVGTQVQHVADEFKKLMK
ncbi:MAG: N-acetylglucosamine-specific PTS transporter subunit IIBC [Oscillospiraceae bacterium]